MCLCFLDLSCLEAGRTLALAVSEDGTSDGVITAVCKRQLILP